MINYCHQSEKSCSACCGLFNLNFSFQKKRKWLLDNTITFLEMDIRNADNLVAFRKLGELRIKNSYIREDIYVCPFIGYTDKDYTRNGCLLHPEGSLHPDISYWKDPQNFSFYGSTICQGYNCISKETQAADLFIEQVYVHDDEDSFLYDLIVANHNLHKICKYILYKKNSSSEADLYKIILEFSKEYKDFFITTSFEEISQIDSKCTLDILFETLGKILCNNMVFQDDQKCIDKGKELGNKIKDKFLSKI